jgi:hypothetical protein
MQLAHEAQRFSDLERNYSEYRHFNETEMEKLGSFGQSSQEKYERALEEERRKLESANATVLKTSSQLQEVDRELNQTRAEATRQTNELNESQQMIQQLQKQLAAMQELVRSQEHALQDERLKCERRLAELKETHQETLLASIASAEASKNHDLALLRNSMELTHGSQQKDWDRHVEALQREHEQRCEELRREVADWKAKAADSEKMLDAEKSECTVLRLRLQAQQVSSAMPAQHQRNQTLAALGTNTSINNDSLYLPSIPPLTGNSSLDSPMFQSQQRGRGMFGDQSPQPQRYSNSLNNSGTSFLDSPMTLPPNPPAAGDGTEGKPSKLSSLFNGDGDGASVSGAGAEDSNLMSVVNENEELRKIIKQVCQIL